MRIENLKNMDIEKKPKRPRIGGTNSFEDGISETRYEKVNYPNDEKRKETRQHFQSRQSYPNRGFQSGYQNRPNYQRSQEFQNRTADSDYVHTQDETQSDQTDTTVNEMNQGLNDKQTEVYQPRQASYQPRHTYQPRQNYHNERSYQPRQNYQQNGYNQPGGYRNQQGGGYQNRQSGYNQQGYRQQGNYNNYRQGGYNQGGYQNRQGSYNQGGYQNRQGGFGPQGYNQGGFRRPTNNMKFTPRPKQVDYVIDDIDPAEEVRLNKFMANAGICSRREADDFIAKGRVKVNGEVTTELGTKIKRDDVVEFDDKVVVPERKCYVLLNKPKDCVTTSEDPNGRVTVLDIVKNACKERIYPVGRLDRNTTGVLLLTNDGDLASKLTHPKFVKKKIYHVWTDKDISEEDMQQIADGIELSDGEIHADAISYVSETERNQAGIEIHSGRNRIVRRIFEHLGYRVTKLDRVYFAGLTKKNLPRGRWRYLTQEEVTALRTGRFE